MKLVRKMGSEFFGTFWLVLGGCGSAILSASYPSLGIGFVGVSFAFGLAVLTMAYAVGHISGAHFNPAVSLGLWAAGKFETKELVPYILSQVSGGIAGAAILFLIASGQTGFEAGGFAANGFGELSPGKYEFSSVVITETIMTFMFLFIILGSTSPKAPAGFAPISIGLGLTLIHLISIPISNTSVNPARSTASALFAETSALSQLWVFWIFPIMGAVLAGITWRLFISGDRDEQ